MALDSFPFLAQQGRPFVTGPFLGGYVYVLPSPVAAGGTATLPHPFKAIPRSVFVLAANSVTVYPSRVLLATGTTASTAVVKFESAQPSGTALFLV